MKYHYSTLSQYYISLLSTSEVPISQQLRDLLSGTETATAVASAGSDQDVGVAVSQDSAVW